MSLCEASGEEAFAQQLLMDHLAGAGGTDIFILFLHC